MTKNRTFNIILMVFIIIGFYGCEKEFATVTASGIVDTTTVNFSNKYSKFIVRATNKKLNPVQSNNMPSGLIGAFNNNAFGSYKADFVSQLRPSQFNPTFATELEQLTIDKVIFSMPFFSTSVAQNEDGSTSYQLDSIYANKDGDFYKTIKISVYESNYFIRDFDPTSNELNVSQNYYSNKSTGASIINDSELEKELLFELDNFEPSAQEIQITENDSIIERLSPRIYTELDNIDYWQSKIFDKQGSEELSNSNNFNNYFRGLYFKVTTNDNLGSLFMFDPSQANITIYYSTESIDPGSNDDENEEDAVTNKTFTLSLSGNRINFFENNLNVPEEDESTLYLSGTEGAMGVLELFDEETTEHPNSNEDNQLPDVSIDIKDLINKDILINEANIVIEKTSSNDFEPHRLFIYDAENSFVLSDYNFDISASSDPATSRTNHLSTLYTETINDEVRAFYKFKVTNHIKNIIKNDSTNVKIGLTVSANVNLESEGITYDILDQDFPRNIPVSSNFYPKATKLSANYNNEISENVYLEIYYTEQKQ